MTTGPNTWNVGSKITIEVFIGDPNTGLGLIDQESYSDLTIRRDSDSLYWSGSAWLASRTTLTLTQPDSTNEPGRYNFVLSAAGNTTADRYVAFVTVNNPPLIEGHAVEAHVSTQQDVRLYESEPA